MVENRANEREQFVGNDREKEANDVGSYESEKDE